MPKQPVVKRTVLKMGRPRPKRTDITGAIPVGGLPVGRAGPTRLSSLPPVRSIRRAGQGSSQPGPRFSTKPVDGLPVGSSLPPVRSIRRGKKGSSQPGPRFSTKRRK